MRRNEIKIKTFVSKVLKKKKKIWEVTLCQIIRLMQKFYRNK